MATKKHSHAAARGVRTCVKSVRKRVPSQNMVVHKSSLDVKRIGNKPMRKRFSVGK